MREDEQGTRREMTMLVGSHGGELLKRDGVLHGMGASRPKPERKVLVAKPDRMKRKRVGVGVDVRPLYFWCVSGCEGPSCGDALTVLRSTGARCDSTLLSSIDRWLRCVGSLAYGRPVPGCGSSA